MTRRATKPLKTVRAALETTVPALDRTDAGLPQDGTVDEARILLECQVPLSIFGVVDHGSLPLTAGPTRKAIPYDIGNPLTVSRMTRRALAADLYTPIRGLLREDAQGRVTFGSDRPATTFGQFGNPEIDRVARYPDARLRTALAAAAG